MNRTRPCVWMAAMLLTLGPRAWAQSSAESAALDVAALLDATQLQPGSINDTAWTLNAQPGFKLIALPVTLTPGDEPVDLDRPSFTLRGAGRFLCWQVPAPTAGAQQPGGFGEFGGEFDEFNQFNRPGQFQPYRPNTPAPVAAAVIAPPADAPHTARKIKLLPDGNVQWELDRSLANTPNAVPNTTSLFALKVRPDLLRAQEPQRPVATPGTAVTPEQRRTEQATYREQVTTFNALREQVRGVPETFEQADTPRVFAIYEVAGEVPDLSFNGDPPLPWRIGLTDLQALGAIATQGGGGRQPGQLDAQTITNVQQLSTLAADNHPLTHRLIGTVLLRSNLAGAASRGDAVYRLLSQLLASDDLEARATTLQALGNVNPPTPATTALLQESAQNMPPELKLIALGGLMNGNFANPQDAAAMIRVLQDTLYDPQGPDAGDVLRQVVERVPNTPEVANRLAGELDFGRLSPQRLDQAIAYLVAAAPTRPLAAAWLDRGLIGAINPQVHVRTLQRIAEADTGPSPARTVASWIKRLAFKPAEGAVDTDVRLKLTGPLPIASAQHALLNRLNSNDPATRDLAWRALLAFTVNPPPQDPNNPGFNPNPYDQPQPGQTTSPAADVIARIMDAAMSRPATPTTLAPFLSRQRDPSATEALARVLIEGNDQAAGQAATALLGSGRQIGVALMAFDPAKRATFAQRFYEQVAGEAMPVVQLLRYPEPIVANWLGGQIAAGRVPQANEWAQSLTEPTLVRLAGSSDTDLAAGAVATLVFSAGGDRFAVDEQVQRFAALTDRSEAGISGAWASARKDIFTRRLSEAAGMYALKLLVYPIGGGPQVAGADPYGGGFYGGPIPGEFYVEDEFGAFTPPQAQPGTAAAPPQELTLATVELVADGSTVSFRNSTVAISVPADVFAIRLNNAGELKNFPVEAIEKIDLQSISQPIDLLPQTDGSWKGAGTMRDGAVVEVVLEPTDNP